MSELLEKIGKYEIVQQVRQGSMGTVMYQMLTGNHPFKADTLSAINKRITTEEPPPLPVYRNDLPDGLFYTLRRLLRKTASHKVFVRTLIARLADTTSLLARVSAV